MPKQLEIAVARKHESKKQKRIEEESPAVGFLKWLLFTVGASYLLLLIKLVIGRLFWSLDPSVADCMSEIMVAVIVIFAEALHMMSCVKKQMGSFEQSLRLLVGVFSVVGIIFSAVVFGILLTPTGSSIDESSAKGIAIGLVIASFIFGVSTQLYVIAEKARKERANV
ncbi:MAG: hypothetical protein FWE98_08350 [Oscillospiraceae bacterium]|nr:hypothetical protein [Oscillospiraceae bacterium]